MADKKEYIERGALLEELNNAGIPYNADINYIITQAPAVDLTMLEKALTKAFSVLPKVITKINEQLPQIIATIKAVMPAVLPTVIASTDVVNVVRCKDCEFWDKNHVSCEGLAKCVTGEGGIRYRSGNDFCSRGKEGRGVDNV